MPIHEFTCESCGNTFELLFMSKAEIDDARCPRCQSPEVNKLLSAASFTVKGGNANSGSTSAQPSVQHRSCGSDSCSTLNLPGHTKT